MSGTYFGTLIQQMHAFIIYKQINKVDWLDGLPDISAKYIPWKTQCRRLNTFLNNEMKCVLGYIDPTNACFQMIKTNEQCGLVG